MDSLVREVAHIPTIAIHDPVGETFGRYRVVKLIGKGGMGRVYEADDLELGRRVAIKFLPAAHASHPERVARFIRERVVTADLEHPAIIPIYDSGVWPGSEPFYVMRQVHGEPLDRRLAAAKTLEDRLVFLGNVVSAVDAVAYAHSRGVLHRDLKPANLLVGAFGETFVADWGLAKRLGEGDSLPRTGLSSGSGDTSETEAGSVLGTPAYMAPEQREGAPVDARADVFALGGILYEMIVGRPPAVKGEIVLPDMGPSLTDLSAIAEKALSRSPDGRYPSAKELALELHRLQAGQLVSARRYTWFEIAMRWVGRHRAVVVVSAVATVVMGVVVVLSVARIIRERDTARAERASAEAATRRVTEKDLALVLLQARAELSHDATASLAWLKRYPESAPRWPEALAIGADAAARGVAERVWPLGSTLGSIAFSPDSTTLGVGGVEGTLSLLDARSGSRRAFHAPDGVGGSVVFSPDGRFVVTSDGVDAVRLWTVADGTSRRMTGDAVGGHHIAFSPDGTRLVVRHPGGFDHMWRLPEGQRVDLPTADSLVVFVAGSRNAVVAHGDALDEIALDTGRVVTSAKLDGAPYDLAISGDGRWVAASRYDALVLWEPSSGTLRRVPVGKIVARIVAPSADGRAFATCGILEEAWMFDVATASAHVLSKGERCAREGFSFSPSGATFVTTGLGAELRLHVAGSMRRLFGDDVSIADAAFSPDGRWLASASSDGTARLWALDRGEIRVTEGVPLAGVAAGGRMLDGRPDGSVELGTLGTGERAAALSGPRPESLRWATLSADGRVAVLPDADGTLVAHDLGAHTQRKLGRYDAQDARGPGVTNVIASDGTLLAQADEHGGVHLVDIATGNARSLGRLDDKAFALAFSPDARMLVAGTRAGEIELWDLGGGAGRRLLRTQAVVWAVAVSRDGKWVASAASDGIVRVVPSVGGTAIELVGHVGAVDALDFLPDGRLLSAGTDGTVRLWEIEQKMGVVVRRDPDSVSYLAVSTDGAQVVSFAGPVTSVWKTATLPPRTTDARAFRAWAFAKTTAEVEEGTGRPRSL